MPQLRCHRGQDRCTIRFRQLGFRQAESIFLYRILRARTSLNMPQLVGAGHSLQQWMYWRRHSYVERWLTGYRIFISCRSAVEFIGFFSSKDNMEYTTFSELAFCLSVLFILHGVVSTCIVTRLIQTYAIKEIQVPYLAVYEFSAALLGIFICVYGTTKYGWPNTIAILGAIFAGLSAIGFIVVVKFWLDYFASYPSGCRVRNMAENEPYRDEEPCGQEGSLAMIYRAQVESLTEQPPEEGTCDGSSPTNEGSLVNGLKPPPLPTLVNHMPQVLAVGVAHAQRLTFLDLQDASQRSCFPTAIDTGAESSRGLPSTLSKTDIKYTELKSTDMGIPDGGQKLIDRDNMPCSSSPRHRVSPDEDSEVTLTLQSYPQYQSLEAEDRLFKAMAYMGSLDPELQDFFAALTTIPPDEWRGYLEAVWDNSPLLLETLAVSRDSPPAMADTLACLPGDALLRVIEEMDQQDAAYYYKCMVLQEPLLQREEVPPPVGYRGMMNMNLWYPAMTALVLVTLAIIVAIEAGLILANRDPLLR